MSEEKLNPATGRPQPHVPFSKLEELENLNEKLQSTLINDGQNSAFSDEEKLFIRDLSKKQKLSITPIYLKELIAKHISLQQCKYDGFAFFVDPSRASVGPCGPYGIIWTYIGSNMAL